jgi:hypothetical protein
MPDVEHQILSRRRWLSLVSASTVAASIGGDLSRTASAAETERNNPQGSMGAKVFDVRAFGAAGDGKALDTPAVQAAIDACNQDHGGTVLVPAGIFLIGTIELKSNVTLRIAAKGKLLGSADGKQYHAADAIPLEGDATLRDGNTGLIFAVNAENITIEGPGTIDGQGAQFHSPVRGASPPSGRGGNKRPYHILLHRCRNVRIRDLFLVAGAYHSIRVIQSQYVWADGLHIYNRVNNNNDGFHFISSQYVHVSNCDLQTQDDACALFGSCQNVTVTNSTFSTRWSVFRFGGGIAKNIAISNCVIYETYGCPIKIQCGPGSRFEDISFSNLIMKDVTGPIYIGAASRRESRRSENSADQTERPPGIVRNISFNCIRATVVVPVPLPDVSFISNYNPGEIRSCLALNGTGAAFLEKISFHDVHITYPGGGTSEQSAVRDVPERAGEYFQQGVMPAYGLFARNVHGMTLNNVRFDLAASDLRPAVVLHNVQDVTAIGLNVQGESRAESVLRFIGAQDVLLSATRLLTPAAVFLQVEGTDNQAIILDGGDWSKASETLILKAGAKREAVKLQI